MAAEGTVTWSRDDAGALRASHGITTALVSWEQFAAHGEVASGFDYSVETPSGCLVHGFVHCNLDTLAESMREDTRKAAEQIACIICTTTMLTFLHLGGIIVDRERARRRGDEVGEGELADLEVAIGDVQN